MLSLEIQERVPATRGCGWFNEVKYSRDNLEVWVKKVKNEKGWSGKLFIPPTWCKFEGIIRYGVGPKETKGLELQVANYGGGNAFEGKFNIIQTYFQSEEGLMEAVNIEFERLFGGNWVLVEVNF